MLSDHGERQDQKAMTVEIQVYLETDTIDEVHRRLDPQEVQAKNVASTTEAEIATGIFQAIKNITTTSHRDQDFK